MEAEPRSPENLPRHELIGLAAEVVESPDPTQVGLRGRVVDETQRTLVLDDGEASRRVAKRHRTFAFDLDGGTVRVDGDAIAHRPKDRTKKVTSW